MGLGRAPIAQKTGGKRAREIVATPDGNAFAQRIFQRTVDPPAAGPLGRTEVPARMIVEGEERERLVKLARPDRAQVTKIAGTEEGEGAKFTLVPRGKSVDAFG